MVGNYTYRSDNGTWVTFNDTSVYHVLEFQTVELDFDVFDASICFDVDQHSYLSLTLPLPAGVLFTSLDHTLLKSKVRTALSQAVNIPASRIGGIHVSTACVDSSIRVFSCYLIVYSCVHIKRDILLHEHKLSSGLTQCLLCNCLSLDPAKNQ